MLKNKPLNYLASRMICVKMLGIERADLTNIKPTEWILLIHSRKLYGNNPSLDSWNTS